VASTFGVPAAEVAGAVIFTGSPKIKETN
jgi:hypothetical protein